MQARRRRKRVLVTDQEAAALLDAVSGQDCPLTVLRKQGRDLRPDLSTFAKGHIFVSSVSEYPK